MRPPIGATPEAKPRQARLGLAVHLAMACSAVILFPYLRGGWIHQALGHVVNDPVDGEVCAEIILGLGMLLLVFPLAILFYGVGALIDRGLIAAGLMARVAACEGLHEEEGGEGVSDPDLDGP